MKTLLTLLVIVLLTGCASDPAKRLAVAKTEVGRMTPPPEPLMAFATFELMPIEMSDAVKADAAKVVVSNELGDKLAQKLSPLLTEWTKQDRPDGRALAIQARVMSLRVVSGGARFFLGAMMGESSVDMDLLLTDKASGTLLTRQRISRSADSMAGAWSVGATDRNLLDYIVDIAYEYLTQNYNRR